MPGSNAPGKCKRNNIRPRRVESGRFHAGIRPPLKGSCTTRIRSGPWRGHQKAPDRTGRRAPAALNFSGSALRQVRNAAVIFLPLGALHPHRGGHGKMGATAAAWSAGPRAAASSPAWWNSVISTDGCVSAFKVVGAGQHAFQQRGHQAGVHGLAAALNWGRHPHGLAFPVGMFQTIPGSVPGVSAGGLLWIAPKRLPIGLPCAGGAKGRVMVASASAPGNVHGFQHRSGKAQLLLGPEELAATAASFGVRDRSTR
jgi:hypothetical protein